MPCSHDFLDAQAADSGNLDEFKRLYLADTTRLEYRDSKGKGAIHFAAAKNHVNILQYIKEHRGGKLCWHTTAGIVTQRQRQT